MAEVEIGLGAVVGDEALAVLIGRHRAGIDVQIGIELAQPHGIAARLQQRAERRRGQTLAERGNHAAGDENIPRHADRRLIAVRRIVAQPPRADFAGTAGQFFEEAAEVRLLGGFLNGKSNRAGKPALQIYCERGGACSVRRACWRDLLELIEHRALVRIGAGERRRAPSSRPGDLKIDFCERV